MATPTAITRFTPVFKPLTNITPFTFRDGYTFLEMYEALRAYLTETLSPEIDAKLTLVYDEVQAQVNALAEDVNASKDAWQAFFDQFMANVIVELEGLNDQAVANLVNTVGSQIRIALDGLYADTTNPWRSHTFYGISGDRASLESAIAAAPLGYTITLPKNMVFALGATPITINRDVNISGGTFTANNTAFVITADGVRLSDFTINGPGNTGAYVANKPAIDVRGTVDNYISFELKNGKINGQVDGGVRAEFVRDFLIEKVVVDKFRYAGIAILSGEDGLVTRSTVKHANQPETLSYGMFASDAVNLVANRSKNITFSHNTVHDVPNWEGMDTHGGVNIRFLYNTITQCRNAIVMGVGSNTRKTAPIGCLAHGNYIDGMSATPLAPENGILLGGSDSDNINGALYADAIITNNTIVNVSVKTNVTNIMTQGASIQSQRIDYSKTIVANNGGDLRFDPARPTDRQYEETTYDTGWKEATEYGVYAQGWVRNAQWPLEIRVSGDHTGRTVFMRGAMSRSSIDPPLTRDLFNLNYVALIPQTTDGYPLGVLKQNADGGDTRVMVLYSDGMISHSFPTAPSLEYVTMTATWRV